MNDNLHLDAIRRTYEKLVGRLRAIAELNEQVPILKTVLQDLEWMMESEETAPQITWGSVSEPLLDNLADLDKYLLENTIPSSWPYANRYFTVSTTSSTSDYEVHVIKVGNLHVKDEDVENWVQKVTDKRLDLKKTQKRREIIAGRLTELSKNLGTLHTKAISSTLIASAQVQPPSEAAINRRELLVQFKGELIGRCRQGNGTKYTRISENLVYDQEEIRLIASEQQDTYDALHAELSQLAKGRATPKPNRLEETLVNIEDHIFILTTALDPEKSKLSFSD